MMKQKKMEIPARLKNLKFCRIIKGKKKPFELDWTNKPYTYEEILKFFPKENYGVLCGYENLAVIDCDNEAMQIAVKNLFPKTLRVKTKNGFHNYFFIPDLKQKLILESSDGNHLGEIQSFGAQVVGPGSIHPSGQSYELVCDENIATISCQDLYDNIKPFIKQLQKTEENVEYERKLSSEIDELSVANIWGTAGLKSNKHGEYYGSHPIHGSSGGMNFWINPSKNMWHCFRCNSGGGVLSAIAVKEGIIDCSEARPGNLRGDKAYQAIQKAKEKYGLIINKTSPTVKIENKDPVPIIWEYELKDWQENEKEWIIERLIPSRAVCVLTGKRGTLKTFITLLMSYAVASGNKFLDTFSTRKGGVIYLDKENGVQIMKKRTALIKNGLELNGEKFKIGFICFSQLKIDKFGDVAAIEKIIEEHEPILLVIDTYRRGISFDENDAGKVSQLFVDTLRPLVEKYNISIILIHHNRKSGQGYGDEMDELRGSSDLANYADIILKMERKGNNLILKQLKNRNAEEETPMRLKTLFEKDYIKIDYEGEFVPQSRVERCVEAITIWIAKNKKEQVKTAELKEVAFKEGFKLSLFKLALKALQDSGAIMDMGYGLWEITK